MESWLKKLIIISVFLLIAIIISSIIFIDYGFSLLMLSDFILLLVIFLLPPLLSFRYGWGVGFINGAGLSVLYNFFDFAVIKSKIICSASDNLCGIENIGFFIVSLIFIVIGVVIIIINKVRNKRRL